MEKHHSSKLTSANSCTSNNAGHPCAGGLRASLTLLTSRSELARIITSIIPVCRDIHCFAQSARCESSTSRRQIVKLERSDVGNENLTNPKPRINNENKKHKSLQNTLIGKITSLRYRGLRRFTSFNMMSFTGCLKLTSRRRWWLLSSTSRRRRISSCHCWSPIDRRRFH